MSDLTSRSSFVLDHVPQNADAGDTGRFELAARGTTATLDYRTECRLVLARTNVPPFLDESSHRIGGQLLRAAIALAEADRLILVPSCPFARRWIRDHPEAVGGIAIDWPTADTPQG